MSWHFKWLRDDLAAAHVLNTVGTGIAIGLVLAHSFTGYGTDRRSLRIMQIGTGIFVLAGPIDVINHRVNGLDLTAWSPSHLLLYGGTAIMIAGVIRNWYHSFPSDDGFGRQWRLGLIALWAFMFEDMFFPTGQQEYGILEIESWFRGQPYAEPELMRLRRATTRPAGRRRRDRIVRHADRALGLPGVGALRSASRCWSSPGSWSASGSPPPWWSPVTSLYRCLIWPLLTFTIFPPSVVPFWLLPVGLAVDATFLLRLRPYLRAAVGAIAVTLVGLRRAVAPDRRLRHARPTWRYAPSPSCEPLSKRATRCTWCR